MRKLTLMLCCFFILGGCSKNETVEFFLHTEVYHIDQNAVKYRYIDEELDRLIHFVVMKRVTASELQVEKGITLEEATASLEELYKNDLKYFETLEDVYIDISSTNLFSSLKNETDDGIRIQLIDYFSDLIEEHKHAANYTFSIFIDFSKDLDIESFNKTMEFLGTSGSRYDKRGMSLETIKSDEDFILHDVFVDGEYVKLD